MVAGCTPEVLDCLLSGVNVLLWNTQTLDLLDWDTNLASEVIGAI